MFKLTIFSFPSLKNRKLLRDQHTVVLQRKADMDSFRSWSISPCPSAGSTSAGTARNKTSPGSSQEQKRELQTGPETRLWHGSKAHPAGRDAHSTAQEGGVCPDPGLNGAPSPGAAGVSGQVRLMGQSRSISAPKPWHRSWVQKCFVTYTWRIWIL